MLMRINQSKVNVLLVSLFALILIETFSKVNTSTLLVSNQTSNHKKSYKNHANSKIQPKVIMFLGPSGSGKTSLINYLNGVKLAYFKSNGIWRLYNLTASLPGGFEIGHTTKSQTLYPAVYTPMEKDFSFIDNPGFSDNRGFDIANGFFLKNIIQNVSFIKFVLVIKHDDLFDRGKEFRASIKALSNLIGFFNQSSNNHTEKINHLAKSIGIVVTKVKNEDENDEIVKAYVKTLASEILAEERAKTSSDSNYGYMISAFRRMILELSHQVEIFPGASNVKRNNSVLNDLQKNVILSMIHRLSFISKNEANIRVLSENDVETLVSYINENRDQITKDLEKRLKDKVFSFYIPKNNFSNHYNYTYNNSRNMRGQDLLKMKFELDRISRLISKEKIKLENVFEFIVNLSLSNDEFNHGKINYLNHLISLLPSSSTITPESYHDFDFITSDFKSTLNDLRESLSKQIKNYTSNSVDNLNKLLDNLTCEIFYGELARAFYIQDLEKLVLFLKHLNFAFLNSPNVISKKIPSWSNDFNQILAKDWVDLKELVDEVTYIIRENILNRNQIKESNWSNDQLVNKIKCFLNDLEMYGKKNFGIYNDSHFTYRGHFERLSSILTMINTNESIQKLSTIRIYMTHSLWFDADFKINSFRYKSNAPDLYIISPKLVVTLHELTINLSCERIPDSFAKARDGLMPGEAGQHGQHGSPGYNGGRLFIFTSKFFNSSSIRFYSRGGIGGKGQDGGDGANGLNGKNATELESKSLLDKCFPRNFLSGICGSEKLNPTLECNLNCFRESVESYSHLKSQVCIAYGEIGGEGGHGGEGGIGGRAGNPGRQVSIFLDENYKNISFSEQVFIHTSVSGEKGQDGRPGLGGRFGEDFECSRKCLFKSVDYCKRKVNRKLGPSGDAFSSETNEINPKMASESNPLLVYEVETEYLNYIININSSFKYGRFLENNFTKNIIDEKFWRPNLFDLIKRVEILSGYEHKDLLLLVKNETIDFYTRQDVSTHEQLVLNYTLANIETILYNHSRMSELSTFITDVKEFIRVTRDTLVSDWDKLADQDIRGMYVKTYENNLETRMNETNEVIKRLQDDIQKDQFEISKILLEEFQRLILLKSQSFDNFTYLMEKKQKIKDELTTKKIFSNLNGVMGILSLLGPKGAIVNFIMKPVLETASMILEKNKPDENNHKSNSNRNGIVTDYMLRLKRQNKIEIKLHGNIDSNRKKNSNKVLNDSDLTIEQEIEANQREIQELIHLEDLLIDLHNKLVDRELEILNKINSEEKSGASLIYKNNYLVKNILGELKYIVGKLSSIRSSLLSDSQAKLLNPIRRVQFGVDTMSQIYTQIESLQQHKDLATFMADITASEKTRTSNIPIEYQNSILSLKKRIMSNVIRERYTRSLQAFDYWSFPFYCEFRKRLKLNESRIDTGSSQQTVDFYSANLIAMYDLLNDYDTTIVPEIDNNLMYYSFNKTVLAVWSTQNHSSEIRSLFNGSVATFYADINECRFDAVKFSVVQIRVETKENSSANTRLDQFLSHIDVELTHSGRSYYKWRTNVRIIDSYLNTSHRLSFTYQYNCLGKDNCGDANAVYKKLEKHKPLLSPYTFWEIRFKFGNDSHEKLAEIQSIVKYNLVSISLIGKGTYVTKKQNNGDQNFCN